MSREAYPTPLQLAKDIGVFLQAGRANSLPEFTSNCRVEATALVDARLSRVSYIDDVMSNLLNIFSGYYLLAFNHLVGVDNVNVVKLLDRLNPSRSPVDAAINTSWRLSQESFESGLDIQYPTDQTVDTGRSAQQYNDNSNLSTGKLLELSVSSGGQTGKFNVMAKIRGYAVRNDVMTDTLALTKRRTGLADRLRRWSYGEIGFIKDVLLAQDLIEQHRKNLLNDPSGYYASAHARASQNKLAGLLSGNPSVATASSIFVMEKQTARELELKIRGELDDKSVRDKIMADLYGMLMCVVDTEDEMVTIYHKSIDEPTIVSLKEIQRKSKNGKGPDITDVLKAFMDRSAPRF